MEELNTQTMEKSASRADLVIEPLPGGMYQVRYKHGGRRPQAFEGAFTSHMFAEHAISSYLAE